MQPQTTNNPAASSLGSRLNDPLWRLHHLYWIEDKSGIDKLDIIVYKKYTKKFTTKL